VRLVDQAADHLPAGQDRRVEGGDLQFGLRLAVDDRLQVIADVELRLEHRVERNRTACFCHRRRSRNVGQAQLVEHGHSTVAAFDIQKGQIRNE
jgi:hypothetical protein